MSEKLTKDSIDLSTLSIPRLFGLFSPYIVRYAQHIGNDSH